MEEYPVLIVGAGPAGLTLALSLALLEIHSIILEKEVSVNEDPRGVFLAGDAVRIFYQVGIGDEMEKIGHQVETVNFHRTNFVNPPFITMDQTHDTLQQTVPDGVLQVQPRLEAALRSKIKESKFCTLQCGAKVVSREELPDGLIVEYEDQEHSKKRIKCSYLVGADGKTGVVRKQFLEPTAGIRQEVGLFKYTGTWVAANLKIHLPTPKTHSELPFWSLGLTPEAVYDLFWPPGWHFCSPPGKATACGRFGPMHERFWRHEFAEPDWNEKKDSEALLWEHLLPMLTRSSDSCGRPFSGGAITFPKDCIEIRRCRPFTFSQKVVNKWFHKRTILIGDAAHVFPPFGGQGIACGIRDAHALAWRLAIFLRCPIMSDPAKHEFLEAWSIERRQGVDSSARLTMQNGLLCNEVETWSFFFLRKAFTFLGDIGLSRKHSQWNTAIERKGYLKAQGGFFLPDFGGGIKIAQIYLRYGADPPMLSDELLKCHKTAMTLLIINENEDVEAKVGGLLETSGIPRSVLSPDSVLSISSDSRNPRACYICSRKSDFCGKDLRPGYDEDAYIASLPLGTRFAVVRSDFIVFAAARSFAELEMCLGLLKERIDA